MAPPTFSLLRKLARDKRTMREKERLLARTERRLVEHLGRVLSRAGYGLLPAAGGKRAAAKTTTNYRGKPKRLRCPKCSRRFSHPLPMARHMSATHGAKKKTVRKATTGKRKGRVRRKHRPSGRRR